MWHCTYIGKAPVPETDKGVKGSAKNKCGEIERRKKKSGNEACMVLKISSIWKWLRNHTKAAKRGERDYRGGPPASRKTWWNLRKLLTHHHEMTSYVPHPSSSKPPYLRQTVWNSVDGGNIHSSRLVEYKSFFFFSFFFLVHSITSANLSPPLTSGVRYPTIISFLSYLLIPKAKIPPTRENICTWFTL